MWFIIGALVATAVFAYKPELATALNEQLTKLKK